MFALPVQLGGFVDCYPQARGPLHVQGGLAIAWTGFGYSVADGGWDAVQVRPLVGATGYVGAGYDFGPQGAGGFGLFARSHFGFFADGFTNFVPLGFRLGVSVAWL